MTPAVGTILGMIGGAAYFAHSETGIPKTSNCTYLAPWTTDLLAWLAGAYLIYRGFEMQDAGIALMGSIVASIHIAQYAAHKTLVHCEIAEQA